LDEDIATLLEAILGVEADDVREEFGVNVCSQEGIYCLVGTTVSSY
jgi:hypothetical protein